MSKYWENETPKEVMTDKNVLRYYEQSGKLAVSRPDWEDESGNMKQGKTVTLDISAIQAEPAEVKAGLCSILRAVLTAVE